MGAIVLIPSNNEPRAYSVVFRLVCQESFPELKKASNSGSRMKRRQVLENTKQRSIGDFFSDPPAKKSTVESVVEVRQSKAQVIEFISSNRWK